MGYAIAESCALHGAQVVIVSGPVQVTIQHPSVSIIQVQTAEEMYQETRKLFPSFDIGILAAAVADFTPDSQSPSKLKRGKGDLVLRLKPTHDIAAELGMKKSSKQLLIGFALETDNEIDNAKNKLKRKNLDAIVLNSLNDKGAGFGTDTNRISIIDKNNIIDNFELKTKGRVADDIVAKIIKMLAHD